MAAHCPVCGVSRGVPAELCPWTAAVLAKSQVPPEKEKTVLLLYRQ